MKTIFLKLNAFNPTNHSRAKCKIIAYTALALVSMSGIGKATSRNFDGQFGVGYESISGQSRLNAYASMRVSRNTSFHPYPAREDREDSNRKRQKQLEYQEKRLAKNMQKYDQNRDNWSDLLLTLTAISGRNSDQLWDDLRGYHKYKEHRGKHKDAKSAEEIWKSWDKNSLARANINSFEALKPNLDKWEKVRHGVARSDYHVDNAEKWVKKRQKQLDKRS